MSIDGDGWLTTARRQPSPNFNERPAGCDISLVVVHNISLPPGEFGGPFIEDFFTNRLDTTRHPYFETISGLQVSAHLLIRRDGELVQFVPFGLRAWHAGKSSYGGRENCNDYSVGIELEGTDVLPYEAVQYERLAEIIRTLQVRYPAIERHITGHSQIAPERKTDPGDAFDWVLLNARMAVSSRKDASNQG